MTPHTTRMVKYIMSNATGIKWSLESRLRFSEKRKGDGNIPPSRQGVPNSPEQKMKIANTLREMGHHPPPMYGDKNPAWSGGITGISRTIRGWEKYKEWRLAVFERDNYTCQAEVCGKRGGKLEADHKKALALILLENNITSFEEALECKELWDIDNGQTLCKSCHRKTDTFGGRIHAILKSYERN